MATLACCLPWGIGAALGALSLSVFIAGAVFLLSDMGILAINQLFAWPIVAVVTGLAFLLEWLYAART
jgi:hypothetical protein